MNNGLIGSKAVGIMGAGNMGGAIISGLIGAGARNVTVFDPNAFAVNSLNDNVKSFIKVANSAQELIELSEILIIAIKPQVFSVALPKYKMAFEEKNGLLVISVAAGKTLEEIEKLIGNVAIARVMPNICAAVNQSISGVCLNFKALEKGENRGYVLEIFKTIGKVVEIEEVNFSAFSAIAGCSPAFTMMYIDALAQAGVRFGIPKAQALEIAVQVTKGTSMLMESSLGSATGHPQVLIDKVCSPGGTTIEGIISLQQSAFAGIISKAVEASYNKDKNI